MIDVFNWLSPSTLKQKSWVRQYPHWFAYWHQVGLRSTDDVEFIIIKMDLKEAINMDFSNLVMKEDSSAVSKSWVGP